MHIDLKQAGSREENPIKGVGTDFSTRKFSQPVYTSSSSDGVTV